MVLFLFETECARTCIDPVTSIRSAHEALNSPEISTMVLVVPLPAEDLLDGMEVNDIIAMPIAAKGMKFLIFIEILFG